MVDRNDIRLLDMRFEEEDALARAQAGAANLIQGAPPIPGAQLVYSPAGVIGVAVEGAKFVCPLPSNYRGPHLELALIDRGRLIVTHPELPPLLIDPVRGITRAL